MRKLPPAHGLALQKRAGVAFYASDTCGEEDLIVSRVHRIAEARRVARFLYEAEDGAAASLLLSIERGEALPPSARDKHLWDVLLQAKCVRFGRCTPLGSMVAGFLEALNLDGRGSPGH